MENIVVVLLEVLDCEVDHVIDVGGVPRKQDPSGIGWRCIQTGALAREACGRHSTYGRFFSESELKVVGWSTEKNPLFALHRPSNSNHRINIVIEVQHLQLKEWRAVKGVARANEVFLTIL